MNTNDLSWKNIHKIDDSLITYLLYLEGKSIDEISIIRRMDRTLIEKQIIMGKIMIKTNQSTQIKDKDEDILIKIISMDKDDRVEFIKSLDYNEKKIISENIYKRYTKFKNYDDKSLLLWTIGELRDEKLLPFLRMELRSNSVNLRRMACSALGKIGAKTSKSWLHTTLRDENPQVRQYAIKALSLIGDMETVKLLECVVNDRREKDYVVRAACHAIETITSSNLQSSP